MAITVPSDFLKLEKEKLHLDEASFVEYKVIKDNINVEAILKTNVLLFVIQGTKVINCSSGDYTIKSGEAFFLRSGNYVMNQITSGENGYICLLFFLSDYFLKSLVERNHSIFETIKKCDPLKSRMCTIYHNSLVHSSLESLFPYFTETNNYPKEVLALKFDEIVLNLLYSEQNEEFRQIVAELNRNRSEDLKYFMETNFTTRLSLEEYAQQTGRSLTKFKNDFKNIYSESPGRWITSRRLELANRLLEKSDYDVTKINFITGFDNLSYFISCFKKEYGLTPMQFRKSI